MTATLSVMLVTAQQAIDPVDARALLSHVLRRDAAYLIAHADDALDAAAAERFRALAARRAAGEPVAYLTGEREFHSLTFKVTPAVLIPRPETELLVELALERIPEGHASRVLDLGTGSGCIAVSIAKARPSAHVVAVDRSEEALAVARDNARQLGAGNVAFRASEWYGALGSELYDVIVSNPPYVASGDAHLQQGDLRYEPQAALASGADGLDAIRAIVAGAPAHLAAGGWLVIEHGYDQAARCRELMERADLQFVSTRRDLAGLERVSSGRRI